MKDYNLIIFLEELEKIIGHSLSSRQKHELLDSINSFVNRQNEYQYGWDTGYEVGVEDGIKRGEETGHEEGYDDGYYDGYAQCENDVSRTKSK